VSGSSADELRRRDLAGDGAPLRVLRSAIRGTVNYPEVFGLASITETNSGEVTIKASVTGLTDGCHGFHVHLYGDEVGADDGTAAAGHWNPNENPHAAPDKEERHVGDLGNICSTDGKASYTRTFASNDPERPAIIGNFVNSIIGRSFVIHRDPDDLTSQPTGAAGPRVAIGIIGIGNQRLATTESGIETVEVTEHITADDFEIPTTLVCKIRGDGIIGFGAMSIVDGGIEYRASVFGLEPGARGAHIHWYGEEYDPYTDHPDPALRDLGRAGGHYDPTDVAHGLPDDNGREYGDAGNIIVDEAGYGFLQVIMPSPIQDLRSFVGRTCLIHEGTDIGLEPAGQAGPRIAAGQLGYGT
jgi:Cu/Zn superoxide dismutase